MSDPERPDEIICPSCNAVNIPGTLFCVQCGTYLSAKGPLRTEPLSVPEEEHGVRPWGGRGAERAVPATTLEIQILSSGRRVLLSVEREILIGRLDAAHGIFPELDLAPEGGLEQGVSRRHARIYTRDGVCYVEDLDSTNGTYLNSERLTPYLPYVLSSGDTLTLGTARLKINIQTTGK